MFESSNVLEASKGTVLAQPTGFLRVRDPELFDLLMRAQGLSQRELARRAGCHRRTISYLLNGERRAGRDLAERISQCLNSRAAVLFSPGGDLHEEDGEEEGDRRAGSRTTSNGTHGRITEAV